MNEVFQELEKQIESNFNEDIFEDLARKISLTLNSCDDFIQLASLCRWAGFEDDQRAIDMAHDFVDRAVEVCVLKNDIFKLNEIAEELEFGMELDERATEIRGIIIELNQL
jgi:hypothetical protein